MGAEPSGEMRDEKLHATVARSRFGSQEKKTPRPLHVHPSRFGLEVSGQRHSELRTELGPMIHAKKKVKNLWIAPFHKVPTVCSTATALLVRPFCFLVLKWRWFKSKHLPRFYRRSCRWLSSHVSQAYQQNLRKNQMIPAISSLLHPPGNLEDLQPCQNFVKTGNF